MRIAGYAVLLSLVLLAGCKDESSDAPTTGPSSGGASGELANVSLQLNWKPEPQFGGFYAARENGAYRKNGLDVEVVAGGVGTPTVQMVGAGRTDFAVVSADEIVVARAQGNDVVALFAVYQTNPQGLMTHASRGFNQIGDIFAHEGTVAMQRGLPYAQYLEHKFGFDKVNIVPSPGGDLSAFRSDPNYTMQCFVTSEPIAAKKLGLDPRTFLVADAGYNPYTTVLVTRGDYLKAHPDRAAAMVKAVAAGWQSYLNDPGPTNAFMHELNPTMDEQTMADSAMAQVPLIQTSDTEALGLGAMTLVRWQTLCKQLADLKVVEQAPKAEECFVWER